MQKSAGALFWSPSGWFKHELFLPGGVFFMIHPFRRGAVISGDPSWPDPHFCYHTSSAKPSPGSDCDLAGEPSRPGFEKVSVAVVSRKSRTWKATKSGATPRVQKSAGALFWSPSGWFKHELFLPGGVPLLSVFFSSPPAWVGVPVVAVGSLLLPFRILQTQPRFGL